MMSAMTMSPSLEPKSGETLPKIGIIGAGVSGLCAAIQLQKQLGIDDYTIFDENTEVGGTWWVNKYPGCACDIPSHFYSYSFEPNPNWSEAFSSQPEILKYLQNVARKYNVYKNIRFSHQVKSLRWNEPTLKWEVVVKNKKNGSETTYTYDIVFVGVGGLRVPKIPDEFESFKGPKMHSAQWDSKIRLENKTVGIVGTGASAVQIIPQIADKVKKLVVYQRNPPWVLPRYQFKYPNWVQWVLENIPVVQKMHRASWFWLYEMTHSIYNKESTLGRWASGFGKSYIKKETQDDPKFHNKLTPSYPVGCKRITPSDEYYATLLKPTVQMVTNPIQEVKVRSILTEDGNEEKLDVLILATGFKVADLFAPLEISTADSTDLLTMWKNEGPKSYLGITASLTPNLFIIIGPNGPPGNTSIIFAVECSVNWMIQVMAEMMRRKAKRFQVEKWAEDEYMDKITKQLDNTVWAVDCGNWYTDAKGRVIAPNPVNGFNYWWKTRSPDFNKLKFD